jgi:hypothetical protein
MTRETAAVFWFAVGTLIGQYGVRRYFGAKRWVVRLTNGYESERMSWFMARAARRSFPRSLTRIVRVG